MSIKTMIRTSLVVQWLRIHLPMQGTQGQYLAWEDSAHCRATKPTSWNYWNLCTAWSLRSAMGEAPTMRSPHITTRESPLLATTRESLGAAVKTKARPKINKKFLKRVWSHFPIVYTRILLAPTSTLTLHFLLCVPHAKHRHTITFESPWF